MCTGRVQGSFQVVSVFTIVSIGCNYPNHRYVYTYITHYFLPHCPYSLCSLFLRYGESEGVVWQNQSAGLYVLCCALAKDRPGSRVQVQRVQLPFHLDVEVWDLY
jgi:hypothetical protein